MTVYTTIDSPLGELLLVGEESATANGGTALASLSLPGQKGGAVVQDGWRRDPGGVRGDRRPADARTSTGRLTHFDIEYVGRRHGVPAAGVGALEEIPYGTTTTLRGDRRPCRYVAGRRAGGGYRDRAQSAAGRAAVPPGDRRGRGAARLRGRGGAQGAAPRSRGRAGVVSGRGTAVPQGAGGGRARRGACAGVAAARSASGNGRGVPGLGARARPAPAHRLPGGGVMSVQTVCLGWHWQPYRYTRTADDVNGARVARSRTGWSSWAAGSGRRVRRRQRPRRTPPTPR